MNNDTLQKYLDGSLTIPEKHQILEPPVPDSSEILFACHPADYMASEVARAVEDCDARLLRMSVTSMRDDLGRPIVSLRVNVRDASGVARSLRRYGYDPIFVESAPDSALRQRARERANELLYYLEI